MKIGTTTFGFRYLLLDHDRAPSLLELVDQATRLGLECLQVCENSRPLELSTEQWTQLVRYSRDAGLELLAGCLTLSPETCFRYAERAAEIPSDTLRVVLEEDGHNHPGRDDVVRFLEAVLPRLEAAGIRLAIENHFDIPCRVLAEVASQYPPSSVGFCIDTANSLRNFETATQVLEQLGPRAIMYHLKDYRITGTNVGFAVTGAPLGSGDLGLEAFLASALAFPAPHLMIENWVPATGDRDRDVQNDREWLLHGVQALRAALARPRPLNANV